MHLIGERAKLKGIALVTEHNVVVSVQGHRSLALTLIVYILYEVQHGKGFMMCSFGKLISEDFNIACLSHLIVYDQQIFLILPKVFIQLIGLLSHKFNVKVQNSGLFVVMLPLAIHLDNPGWKWLY